MLLIKRLSLPMILILLLSCKDKPLVSDTEESGNVNVNNVSTTAFTSSIEGLFKGISKVDIALGNYGVLYCIKTDHSENVFQSWRDGSDNIECKFFKSGTINGESYSGTITGLNPDTEYSFCLYLQGKGNGVREISDVYSFRTLPFKPDVKGVNFKAIHYIEAIAEIEFGIDSLDASGCEFGVLVSDSPDIDVNTAQYAVKYANEYDSKVNLTISGLKPDNRYFCRAYVKYELSENSGNNYLYGPEGSFSTMTSDQMYVDLGLPSGICWANCDLGHFEFVYLWNNAPRYTLESIAQNDVATQVLGGKWRIPTKADIDELITNCDLDKIEYVRHTNYTTDGDAREVNAPVGYVVGQNGNQILFNVGLEYWCRTMNSNDDPNVFMYRAEIGSSGRYKPDTGWVELRIVSPTQNGYTTFIRPVWDPRMHD